MTTVTRIESPGLGWLARAYEWLRATPSGLVALALAVGAGAGAGAVVFRYLILGFTYAFSGHSDYSAAGHASYGYFHGLGFWFVVFAPVVGGLLYGNRATGDREHRRLPFALAIFGGAMAVVIAIWTALGPERKNADFAAEAKGALP